MNDAVHSSLIAKAFEVARLFSKNRIGNIRKETYEIGSIYILSGSVAAVEYVKKPTEKKALCCFVYIDSRIAPRWQYFFPTDSHILGLQSLNKLKQKVENYNLGVA